MGVEEDTTDDEGRVSTVSQNPSTFTDALEVDDKRMGTSGEAMDAAGIQRLAAEPAGAYYARLFREYVAAKNGVGESTDHISELAFASRIKSMEEDAAQKYGRPVRYQVHARNKEVVLLAVPLP